ncbi:26S proteasome non-ATPase regulatory subunit 4 [Trichoplax sp. H2]|nr:26S proteasome non-ATPase regulatory subunit 4 [Trichoplax sp. H2]|eukprot:RDD43558.1 26S proteasome non-ATPase regulatory subunit 4 [Trichoplax sp. H2]
MTQSPWTASQQTQYRKRRQISAISNFFPRLIPSNRFKMVLESTMICVDDSEWMRNGDFLPTRIQAQQDAVNLLCQAKTRQNAENNVGLLTLASLRVLTTLTTDVGKILKNLHAVSPKGKIDMAIGASTAILALKHRMSKNHKMRLIIFIGSPIETEEKDLTKLAKKLKKNKVSVDVVNFGEDTSNTEKLTAFINTVNDKQGSSHLVTVPPGPLLSDALMSSPIMANEDGSMPNTVSGFGGNVDFVDADVDPELAMALRVSLEESRQRQEEESKKANSVAAQDGSAFTPNPSSIEESLLEQALAISLDSRMETTTPNTDRPDTTPREVSSLTEEEQMELAMQMSLQDFKDIREGNDGNKEMDEEMDATDLISDPSVLQTVLGSLEGIDPNSDMVRNLMGSLQEEEEAMDVDDGKKENKDAK